MSSTGIAAPKASELNVEASFRDWLTGAHQTHASGSDGFACLRNSSGELESWFERYPSGSGPIRAGRRSTTAENEDDLLRNHGSPLLCLYSPELTNEAEYPGGGLLLDQWRIHFYTRCAVWRDSTRRVMDEDAQNAQVYQVAGDVRRFLRSTGGVFDLLDYGTGDPRSNALGECRVKLESHTGREDYGRWDFVVSVTAFRQSDDDADV